MLTSDFSPARMFSERLKYQPVATDSLYAFHALVQDPHVRRYLMDGLVFGREWSAERIRDSQALFDRRGVGIWLVYDKNTENVVGFCGFLEIAPIPEPQLVYAMFERFSGQGYAVEMARTAIAQARRQPGFAEIFAAVDEANVASVRVLEKLGFERVETRQGRFGNMFVLRLVGEPQ